MESFDLTTSDNPFGILATPLGSQLIVDLGKRRTVSQISANITTLDDTAELFLDMGGMWLQLDNDGGIAAPDDTISWAIEDQILQLPLLASQRFRINYNAVDGQTVTPDKVTVQSYPTNLTLRLGDLGAFWFHTGDLKNAVTTPDFSRLLTDYLGLIEPDGGYYAFPLTLHSDSLARLQLALVLEYDEQQSLLPAETNALSFSYGYDGRPVGDGATLPVKVPAGQQVKQISADIRQRFASSRIVAGTLNPVKHTETVVVEATQAAACLIELTEDQVADSLDLNLESLSENSSLALTLQADAGGKPFGAQLWSSSLELNLSRADAAKGEWHNIPLTEPFTFKAGQRYWLVCNSIAGRIALGTEKTAASQLQVSQDYGLSWRRTKTEATVAALLRLRATPATFQQPLHLQVGEQMLSLAPFNANGDKPLSIRDWPTLSQALNQEIAAVTAAQTNTQQRVVNGQFQDWSFVSHNEQFKQKRVASSSGNPFYLLAADSSGQQTYAALLPGGNSGTQAALAIIPADADQSDITYVTLPGQTAGEIPFVMGMSGSNQPGQLHLLTGDLNNLSNDSPPFLRFNQLDANSEQTRQIAHISPRLYTVNEALPIMPLAHDAHCQQFYLATRSFSFDGELPGAVGGAFPALIRLPARAAGAAPYEVSQSDVLPLIRRGAEPGNSELWPTRLAVSPDNRVAVTLTTGALQFADLQTATWADGFIGALPASANLIPLDVAISPDGQQLYLLIGEATDVELERGERRLVVWQLDLAYAVAAARRDTPLAELTATTLFITPLPDAGLEWPQRLKIAPDNQYLAVVAQGNEINRSLSQIYLIDRSEWAMRKRLFIPQALLFDAAFTADSRHLYWNSFVTSDRLANSRVERANISSWGLAEWALTAGRIAPVYRAAPGARAAHLGASSSSSAISQLFHVQAEQLYELKFAAGASADGGVAELFWFGEGCDLLAEVTVPVQVVDCWEAWPTHVWRGEAPAGAHHAELRFRQPAGSTMRLRDVSLQAPTNLAQNGDFAQSATASGAAAAIPGWEGPAGLAAQVTTDGLLLAPQPGQPAQLSQRLPVTAGEAYSLAINGYVQQSGQGGAPTEIRLRWLDSLTPMTTHTLTQQQFDQNLFSGQVPADCEEVELILWQPAGGAALISQISFSQPAPLTVPITVLAESEGELTLSNVGVVLEETPPAAPAGAEAVPEPIPCPPTPGDNRPPSAVAAELDKLADEVPRAHCPCCAQHRPVSTQWVQQSRSGMKGAWSRCQTCGASFVAFG